MLTMERTEWLNVVRANNIVVQTTSSSLPEDGSLSVRGTQMNKDYATCLPSEESSLRVQTSWKNGYPQRWHWFDPTWGTRKE